MAASRGGSASRGGPSASYDGSASLAMQNPEFASFLAAANSAFGAGMTQEQAWAMYQAYMAGREAERHEQHGGWGGQMHGDPMAQQDWHAWTMHPEMAQQQHQQPQTLQQQQEAALAVLMGTETPKGWNTDAPEYEPSAYAIASATSGQGWYAGNGNKAKEDSTTPSEERLGQADKSTKAPNQKSAQEEILNDVQKFLRGEDSDSDSDSEDSDIQAEETTVAPEKKPTVSPLDFTLPATAGGSNAASPGVSDADKSEKKDEAGADRPAPPVAPPPPPPAASQSQAVKLPLADVVESNTNFTAPQFTIPQEYAQTGMPENSSGAPDSDRSSNSSAADMGAQSGISLPAGMCTGLAYTAHMMIPDPAIVKDFLTILEQRRLPAALTEEIQEQGRTEILAVVLSFYADRIRPTLSRVQQRLRERQLDNMVVQALLPLCAREPDTYTIWPPVGGEQPVVYLVTEPSSFIGWVNPQVPDNFYDTVTWRALCVRLNKGVTYPADPFRAAEAMRKEKIDDAISKLSLGEVEHIIRLSIAPSRSLLSYQNEDLVTNWLGLKKAHLWLTWASPQMQSTAASYQQWAPLQYRPQQAAQYAPPIERPTTPPTPAVSKASATMLPAGPVSNTSTSSPTTSDRQKSEKTDQSQGNHPEDYMTVLKDVIKTAPNGLDACNSSCY
eukprot:TRINITY_DN8808_c0_g1_i1.p1 TRINITY_DN8808_c0_g1~~TRINITY_DN8808_c0_g1_i1.p1  ORF type:complete len:670 (+),score=127.00 TRINITY_DN8808_c0_g1_i1:57-2066(+)